MMKDVNNTQTSPDGKAVCGRKPTAGSEPMSDAEPVASTEHAAGRQSSSCSGLASGEQPVPCREPALDSGQAPLSKPAPEEAQTSPPKRGGFLEQLSKYFGVSFTQTFVEFGVFAALHGLGLGTSIANVFAITCSASYNFIMNRNITFKSSSNLTRSIVLFVMLYCWNLLFSSTCLAVLPDALGWSSTLVKLLTMACQGVWGFLLSRYVIFR